MALAALASLDELADWLDLSATQISVARAQSVLDVVSAVVRAEARVTWDGVPVPDAVRGVVLRVAAREYRNPTGADRQTTGPFSTGGGDIGGIILTDEEKAIIRGAIGQQRGLWTQGTTRGDDCADTIYVPVEGGPPFPWYDAAEFGP